MVNSSGPKSQTEKKRHLIQQELCAFLVWSFFLFCSYPKKQQASKMSVQVESDACKLVKCSQFLAGTGICLALMHNSLLSLIKKCKGVMKMLM